MGIQMSHVAMSAGYGEDRAVAVRFFNPFQFIDQDVKGFVPANADKLTSPSVFNATFSTRFKANPLEWV
jgi:hypothetical protein